jgi:hypothetical protein
LSARALAAVGQNERIAGVSRSPHIHPGARHAENPLAVRRLPLKFNDVYALEGYMPDLKRVE